MSWTPAEGRRIEEMERDIEAIDKTATVIHGALVGFDRRSGLVGDVEDLKLKVRLIEDRIERMKGVATAVRVAWLIGSAVGGGGVVAIISKLLGW